MLPPALKFHSLRHTYAIYTPHVRDICAAADIPVREVAAFMGRASSRTTESVYTHPFTKDDHSEAMGKLGKVAASGAGRRATSFRCHAELLRTEFPCMAAADILKAR